jgi:guanylate kinase
LNSTGLAVVITAPSGSGKTTIYRTLLNRRENLSFSVSYTTRKPRKQERDGVDYFFISREDFTRKIEAGDFIEWAEVHGDLKGTDRKHFDDCLRHSDACILDLDVQGALHLMKAVPEALTIFIVPPSLEELERRLIRRGTENQEELRVRLANAEKELAYQNRFQYIVVNNEVDEAVKEVEELIDHELQKRS